MDELSDGNLIEMGPESAYKDSSDKIFTQNEITNIKLTILFRLKFKLPRYFKSSTELII